MHALYAYSVVPVLSVALLLFFSGALYGRPTRGLSVYCLAVAVWAASLLMTAVPATAAIGARLVATGAFVGAGFLHAAYDLTAQRRDRLLGAAYAGAAIVTALGIVRPGLLYDPVGLSAGPLFWPSMAAAVVAMTLPLVNLARAWREAPREARAPLWALGASGALCYLGAWANASLVAHGYVQPWGLYMVLASLLLLANVVRARQTPAARRLLERSLLYAALAALISAGFLLGALWLVADREALASYGPGALFLLAMAALAVEPLRQHLLERLGRRFAPDRAAAADLARALTEAEARADHAERLAELGALASAVAHEVRNPLGVLGAHLRLLERGGANAETVAAMRAQIDRATRFVDDLLRYGRPRALQLRLVDLGALVELAWSTARDGLGDAAPAVERRGAIPVPGPVIEVDQAQLVQALVVVFENALLALAEAPPDRRVVEVSLEAGSGRVALTVADGGPGIPAEVRPRLFQPFVTSRRRDDRHAGTGLGLAIARRIVERHGGTIAAADGPLGGAAFTLELPVHQAVLAAAEGQG